MAGRPWWQGAAPPPPVGFPLAANMSRLRRCWAQQVVFKVRFFGSISWKSIANFEIFFGKTNSLFAIVFRTFFGKMVSIFEIIFRTFIRLPTLTFLTVLRFRLLVHFLKSFSAKKIHLVKSFSGNFFRGNDSNAAIIFWQVPPRERLHFCNHFLGNQSGPPSPRVTPRLHPGRSRGRRAAASLPPAAKLPSQQESAN